MHPREWFKRQGSPLGAYREARIRQAVATADLIYVAAESHLQKAGPGNQIDLSRARFLAELAMQDLVK